MKPFSIRVFIRLAGLISVVVITALILSLTNGVGSPRQNMRNMPGMKNHFYTRLELVDKDDLLRPADHTLLSIRPDHPVFRIGAYTLGGVRDLWDTDKVSFAIGSDVTLSKPSILDRIYGNKPVFWKLFFRIRPAKMDMSMHGMHGNMKTTEDKMRTKP